MKTVTVTVFRQHNSTTGETNICFVPGPVSDIDGLGPPDDFRVDSDEAWRKAPLERLEVVLTGPEEAIEALTNKELRSVC